MTPEELLALPQYSLRQADKDRLLSEGLTRLTHHHRASCPAYDQLLSVLHPDLVTFENPNEAPWLPVGLFKTHDLRSIPGEAVFKTLTSSGTTSAAVSRIFLDAESAARQTKALASVMTHVLGKDRLPMIIVESPAVIRDRRSFSARGAGVLGMATFGRDHFYALDENMTLDREGLHGFLDRHAGAPLLIFGFTFMVWQHLLGAVESGEFDLSRATLIHSGGWKKLEEAAVSNADFKASLRVATGLSRVYNFYGMVEQIGSVFVECDEGYLHAPNFGDVIIRNPTHWGEAEIGEEGLLQVVSLLPTSYPGHSILTEDVGSVIAQDDCDCGRAGKAIRVAGRVPKAELRGCSDTYAANQVIHA